MNEAKIICPSCNGQKGGNALVCGPGVSGMRWMPCSFCRGVGKVTPQLQLQFNIGRKLSALRIEKDYTVREVSQQYGLRMSEWSDLEHGRAPVAQIASARAWLKCLPARQTVSAIA